MPSLPRVHVLSGHWMKGASATMPRHCKHRRGKATMPSAMPSSLFPPPADHHASFHGDAAFSSLEDGPGHRSRMCDADFLQGSIFLDLKGFIGFEGFLFFVVVYFYIFLYISSLGSWISGTTKKKKKNFSVERPVGFGVFPVNCAN